MMTLFLAWQNPGHSRAWYPIGRLDADGVNGPYHFHYIRGVEKAQKEAGLQPLISFPDLKKRYESNELFPLFKNRLLSSEREEFVEFLKTLGLDESKADPLTILAITEGKRQTDTLEVFPKIMVNEDNKFHCRFFLHGWRHVSSAAQERISRLEKGESLQVAFEMNNPATGLAIQLETQDYHMIGWTPRYLILDLVWAIGQSFQDVSAMVIRVNPEPAPFQQRVLIEMTGTWPKEFEPMTSEDFMALPIE